MRSPVAPFSLNDCIILTFASLAPSFDAQLLPRLLQLDDRDPESRERCRERYRGPCRGIAGPASWSSIRPRAWDSAGASGSGGEEGGGTPGRRSWSRRNSIGDRGRGCDRRDRLEAVGAGRTDQDDKGLLPLKGEEREGGDRVGGIGNAEDGTGLEGKQDRDASQEGGCLKRW